jgi:hypothetical protein
LEHLCKERVKNVPAWRSVLDTLAKEVERVGNKWVGEKRKLHLGCGGARWIGNSHMLRGRRRWKFDMVRRWIWYEVISSSQCSCTPTNARSGNILGPTAKGKKDRVAD